MNFWIKYCKAVRPTQSLTQYLSVRTKGPEVTLTGSTFYPATRLRMRVVLNSRLQCTQAEARLYILPFKYQVPLVRRKRLWFVIKEVQNKVTGKEHEQVSLFLWHNFKLIQITKVFVCQSSLSSDAQLLRSVSISKRVTKEQSGLKGGNKRYWCLKTRDRSTKIKLWRNLISCL